MLGKEVYHLESDEIQSKGQDSIELSEAGIPADVYFFAIILVRYESFVTKSAAVTERPFASLNNV